MHTLLSPLAVTVWLVLATGCATTQPEFTATPDVSRYAASKAPCDQVVHHVCTEVTHCGLWLAAFEHGRKQPDAATACETMLADPMVRARQTWTARILAMQTELAADLVSPPADACAALKTRVCREVRDCRGWWRKFRIGLARMDSGEARQRRCQSQLDDELQQDALVAEARLTVLPQAGCAAVIARVCAEVPDCDAWREDFERAIKAAGGGAQDMCHAALDNPSAMQAQIDHARKGSGTP